MFSAKVFLDYSKGINTFSVALSNPVISLGIYTIGSFV